MTVFAVHARDAIAHEFYGVGERDGNWLDLTGARKELRRQALCPQLFRQLAIDTAEQYGRFHFRALLLHSANAVTRDQQLVGLPDPRHLDTDQLRCNDDRMDSVRP